MFLDIFSRKRESVHLQKDTALIVPGETPRAIFCYKCDRELGPDHDDERCARKGSTRRVFFGRLAVTAASAAVVAKIVPEMLQRSAQAQAPAEIAAETGLFGDKTESLFNLAASRRAEDPNYISPWKSFIAKRGDVIELRPGGKVILGLEYANLPDHPLMRSEYERACGHMVTVTPKDGRVPVDYDMRIFTAHNEDGRRISVRLIPQDELKATDGGIVLLESPPEKPKTDFDTYVEKRKAEGVKFDDAERNSHRRGDLRTREQHDAGDAGTISPTPLALAAVEKAFAQQQAERHYTRLMDKPPPMSWYHRYYHRSNQRRLALEPRLAGPKGYLPA